MTTPIDTDPLEGEICKIFGIFPEEIEHCLSVAVSPGKIAAKRGWLIEEWRKYLGYAPITEGF